MYKIRYLPKAREDLQSITHYIIDTLKAPKAASDLLDAFDQSILILKQFPYAHKVYQLSEPFELKDEYRVFPVKNYLVFYVVSEDTVEIRRIIYSRMDVEHIIN